MRLDAMPSLDGLLIVVAAGFAAPFLLGLAPGLRVPAVVLEIVAGIVIGPSVLGWVEIDATIEVLAYALSLAIAVAISLALGATGQVETATTAIGQELGLIDAGEAAALVGAGLLSVLLLPAAALALLQSAGPAPTSPGRFGMT